MKAVELRALSLDELKKRLSEEQESLANLRFQLATSQLESPIKVRTVRRDIARLRTLIRQKERNEANRTAPGAATTQDPGSKKVKPS
jgi:large subunit ribosomal protein L29